MEPIIEVKNISKKYKITHQRGGYITLRDAMTNILKNPFAFLKSKSKALVGLETKEVFWALKDINFSVKKGEVVGIVGRNGAGKSTLLKILSQITPPSTGEIKIRGRVGSLLEVGTGFHPELTGRENIFLNGAILGMRQKEIVKKFDEIVKFADIEKFLDTPVKYYSSGMYVRLAFSVAAHMEPDILIIDEVLAVGDIEFQKKCLGKMEDITRNEGRTILFVSHDMRAISDLCPKTILIEAGKIKTIDDTEKVLQIYAKGNVEVQNVNAPIKLSTSHKNKELVFQKVWITKSDGTLTNIITHSDTFQINIEFEVMKEIGPIEITATLKNSRGINVISTSLSDSLSGKVFNFKKGKYLATSKIGGDFLLPDTYNVRLYAHEKGLRDIDIEENAIGLKITDAGSTMQSYGEASLAWATVFSNADWKIETK